jgi:hypothetical protein
VVGLSDMARRADRCRSQSPVSKVAAAERQGETVPIRGHVREGRVSAPPGAAVMASDRARYQAQVARQPDGVGAEPLGERLPRTRRSPRPTLSFALTFVSDVSPRPPQAPIPSLWFASMPFRVIVPAPPAVVTPYRSDQILPRAGKKSKSSSSRPKCSSARCRPGLGRHAD